MDSEKRSENFEGVGGGRLGAPGGGYCRGHGLHGALGVVQKIMNIVMLKKNKNLNLKKISFFHNILGFDISDISVMLAS